MGFGAGIARRTGSPRAAVVPGFKPALFFRAPERSLLKGVGGGGCFCPGRRAPDSVSPGRAQWRRLQSSRVPVALPYPGFSKSFVALKKSCVSGEADLSAESFQGLNSLLVSSFSSTADNLCFLQLALKMSKLSISRIFFTGSFIDEQLIYGNAYRLISRWCCTLDFNV